MKLYVTGGTGFLGSNIVKVAIERHGADVFSTVHAWHSEEPVPFAYAPVDICDRKQVIQSVRDTWPDVIVHSAILNDFSLMYQDRHLAWSAYVDSTRYLIEAANTIGAKLILISTDWVFDGTQGSASETTPPNPVNYYGVLKLICETMVLASAQNGAVARVAGVNGMHWTRPDAKRAQNAGYGHFVTAVAEGLRRGQPFVVWTGPINKVATPSLASESAEMILRIAQQDKHGIFHCCGGEAIERSAFARLIAEIFDLDAGLLRFGPPDPNDPGSLHGYPVPRDTSLDANRTAQALSYELPSVREQVQIYRRQMETNQL